MLDNVFPQILNTSFVFLRMSRSWLEREELLTSVKYYYYNIKELGDGHADAYELFNNT